MSRRDHDYEHDHKPADGRQRAPSEEILLRVQALENLLIDKGLLDSAAVDEFIEHYEHRIGPHVGAKVVARAWADPEYKKRLLDNPNAALAELGVSRLQGEDMVVLENTREVHNVIVCTLCSCYPWNVLGLPPVWYKSMPYRSRMVREPRVVLRDEFGLQLADSAEVRVWDANAELRYMVLPERPERTDELTEEQLAELVTRDSMIGVAQPRNPSRIVDS